MLHESLYNVLYSLDAGLLRQITYTTARMGLFRIFSDAMKHEHGIIFVYFGSFSIV